jgi:hypothetical protein
MRSDLSHGQEKIVAQVSPKTLIASEWFEDLQIATGRHSKD